MGLIDFLRQIFTARNDQEFSYLDAEPNLEPDNDDSGGYLKSQYQPKQYSYLNYEMASDFESRQHTVQIDYQGLLKHCGADAVYLHYGFDNWNYSTIRTEPMNRHNDGIFTFSIPASDHYEVNYCFKDSADHWDNNNGWNWLQKMDQNY